MRQIVLDTETTGISIKEGHRIVEIGCIELDNLIPTKNKFHCYLNPERKVSDKALEIHGYTDDFLSDKKKFFDFNRGAPDGSTIDSDGFIWNCRWGGSCVVKIDPKGRVDQIYQLPVENVTNCVFGGSDLKTLFITTANNSGKNKYDGSLFALNVTTPGIEDNKFKI